MNLRRMAGLALMLVGVLLFANVIQLATVIHLKYFWYSLYPDGSSTNPTLISEGITIAPTIKLVYHDATDNVKLPSPAYWDVLVGIQPANIIIDFGLPDDFLSSVKVDSHLCTVAVWQDSWTVPDGEGVAYTFTWKVVIYDENGNYIDTKEKTTYAKTALNEPDGYFEINDKKATEVTTHIVLDATLKLEFIPTKNAEKLTSVYVNVFKGGTLVQKVTLTGDAVYSASYTLPAHGTYELKGFFTWTGSAIPLQKMTITASWGDEPPPPFSFGTNQILGLIAMAAGGILVFIRKKPR